MVACTCSAIGLVMHFEPTRVPAFTLLCAYLVFLLTASSYRKRLSRKRLRQFFEEERDRLNGQILHLHAKGVTGTHTGGHYITEETWQAFTRRLDFPEKWLFLRSPDSYLRITKPADRQCILDWSAGVPRGK